MKKDFYTYQAQTTPHPLALEVSHAKGSYVFDIHGQAHLDFVAGVSACSLGHCHPKVVAAIQEQVERYMHVMVYGEYIQEPAVALTKLLATNLPAPLETTYLVNSGTEAIEGSLKLARRSTGRSQILYANNAYHGNTLGALSVMGFEERKEAFKPLLPECYPIQFNALEDLKKITTNTAAVLLETIQGGAGFIEPKSNYLAAVKARCVEVGALLILDEIQTGFGRTGTLFGFTNYKVIPDIVVMGKGMAGGMPIGGFTASKKLMRLFQDNPKLGHITTFGGNPVIAAAGLATLKEITTSTLISETLEKEKLFRLLLQHPAVKEIRGKGLMLALILESQEITNQVILACKDKNLLLFWLLFEPCAIRITPPLTITKAEIKKGCAILTQVLNETKHK